MKGKFSEFDVESFHSELDDIQKHIEMLFEIEGSLSDNRKAHRAFSAKINLDFKIIEYAYKLYRPSSIIEIYTFAENLVKTYIYSILGADNTDVIQKFIEKKLPQKSFVPGTKIKEIEKAVKSYTPRSDNLELFIKKFKYDDCVKTFDNLIEARHRYAHRGEFDISYNEEEYKEIISVLYYLNDELCFCLIDFESRMQLQKSIYEILKKLKGLNKAIEKRGFSNICKKIRKEAYRGIRALETSKIDFKSDIYKNIHKDLKLLYDLDLRRTVEYNHLKIEKKIIVFNRAF